MKKGYAFVYDLVHGYIGFILVRVKIEEVDGDNSRVIVDEGNLKGYGVTLPSSMIYKTREEAVDAWNMRSCEG